MEKVRLGDIVDTIQGSQYPVDEQIYIRKEGYERFLRISDYTKINEPERFVKYTGKELMCTEEDVVVVRYGNIGSIGIGKAGILANNLFALKKKGNKDIISKYIYYFLRSKKINNVLVNKANSSTMPALTHKMIKELEIPIYTKELEIKIVKELDKVQEIIDLRKKQIEELEELIRAQFVDMFGDIYDNKNNFIIKELDYYTSMITYGLTIRPKFVEKGIDLISAREINSGNIDYDKAPKISEDDYNKLSDKAKPKKNEILFSKTGTIGLCAIIDSEIKFAITQNAARIVPKENINPIWLLYYLRTDEIQSYCKRQAKGNAVKDFQIQDMKKIPILDCSISKQNEFVEKVKQIDKQKIILKKSLKETEELQESLMNKYFGE